MNKSEYNYLFIFSEALDADSEAVNMNQPLSGENWHINTDEFIKLVISESLEEEIQRAAPFKSEIPANQRNDLKLWIDRGWLWSISYFLATRKVNFLDTGENAETTRVENIEQFSKVAALPMPEYDLNYLDVLPVPEKVTEKEISVGEVLRRRHSVSAPSSKGIEFRTLTSVLSEAFFKVNKTAINLAENGSGQALKSFGSGLDFYITIYDIENVSPGLYRLNPERMTLNLIKVGNFRHEMSQGLIGQQGPKLAACTISIVGDFDRYMWRYRHERALSLLWIDAARVMSSIIWSATSCDLKMQISPAVIDETFLEFLNLPIDLSRQCLYNISLA